jgi:hypothetical protein
MMASVERWAGRCARLETEFGDEMVVRDQLGHVYESVMEDWQHGCTTSRDVAYGVETAQHPDRLIDIANRSGMKPRSFGLFVQVAKLRVQRAAAGEQG